MIRAARPRDYAKLQDIERRADERFRDVGMPEIADAEPRDVDELAAAAALFVATGEDAQPVGYALVELVDGHAHVGQLSVLPEEGGRGVGTQLLDAVAEWATGCGHAEITLTTFRDLPFNGPLYAKRGYDVVPDAELTDGLRSIAEHEVTFGFDPTKRVVMRRRLQYPRC